MHTYKCILFLCHTNVSSLIMQILKSRKNEVTEKDGVARAVKSRLKQLIYVNRQIEREVDHVKTLEQKKAALELTMQSERVKSLTKSLKATTKLHCQSSVRRNEYINDTEDDSPLEHVYDTLICKEAETIKFLDSQICSFEYELGYEQIKLGQLQEKLQNDASNYTLPECSLPTRVEDVNTLLQIAKSNLESLKAVLSCGYRSSELDIIKTGFRELFSNDNDNAKKEKGTRYTPLTGLKIIPHMGPEDRATPQQANKPEECKTLTNGTSLSDCHDDICFVCQKGGGKSYHIFIFCLQLPY